jgi:uncharacterized membrane protein YhaH (DUF805 family)
MFGWFTRQLKNYYCFTGRASKAEYWWFFLFVCLIVLLLSLIDIIIFGPDMMILSSIFLLAMVLPSLSVGARRLHDANLSGWWQAISLVPFVGNIALIVLFCLNPRNENNKYGLPGPTHP